MIRPNHAIRNSTAIKRIVNLDCDGSIEKSFNKDPITKPKGKKANELESGPIMRRTDRKVLFYGLPVCVSVCV